MMSEHIRPDQLRPLAQELQRAAPGQCGLWPDDLRDDELIPRHKIVCRIDQTDIRPEVLNFEQVVGVGVEDSNWFEQHDTTPNDGPMGIPSWMVFGWCQCKTDCAFNHITRAECRSLFWMTRQKPTAISHNDTAISASASPIKGPRGNPKSPSGPIIVGAARLSGWSLRNTDLQPLLFPRGRHDQHSSA